MSDRSSGSSSAADIKNGNKKVALDCDWRIFSFTANSKVSLLIEDPNDECCCPLQVTAAAAAADAVTITVSTK